MELEIDRVWWMWRGCLQDYYEGHDTVWINPFDRGKDGMDRDGYKEASAFPMQKPNFDVFGIPGRTRKQRGWYQVQRHPKSRPKQRILFPAPRSSPGGSTTGADLPIELVRLVGEVMGERLWWKNEEERRTVTTCALVCRHWAGYFLPKMLSDVFICSRQRAFRLWEFDDSPTRCFHRCCHSTVSIDINGLSQLSFIHLLTQMKCQFRQVRLRGPLPRGWKTLRSVHQAVPRSLPRSFSRNIRSLHLMDIHFQRFSDLTHLACELPDLWNLRCDKVASGPLPDTIATFPRLPRTSIYPEFDACMDSDMGMPALVHLLAHRFTIKEYPLLPRANAVLALASLVDGMFNVLTPDTTDSNKSSGTISSHCKDDRVSLGWCYPELTLVAHISAKISRISHHGEIVDFNVTTVIVDLSVSSDDQHSRWNAFNWRELDEQVSALGARFVFASKSRDQILAFGDEVVDVLMPLSSASDSIDYALGKGSRYEQEWYKASRDSDILQERSPLTDNGYRNYLYL